MRAELKWTLLRDSLYCVEKKLCFEFGFIFSQDLISVYYNYFIRNPSICLFTHVHKFNSWTEVEIIYRKSVYGKSISKNSVCELRIEGGTEQNKTYISGARSNRNEMALTILVQWISRVP